MRHDVYVVPYSVPTETGAKSMLRVELAYATSYNCLCCELSLSMLWVEFVYAMGWKLAG